MPATIGSLFRRIVKDLQAQDSNPNNYLNNSNSDLKNPITTSTIQVATSTIKTAASTINIIKNCEEMF
jgi:hypothetical protein